MAGLRHDGKVAVVTGAGSGIGRATALRLAREGAQVLGCSPSPDGLQETLGEIRGIGADAVMVPADLTDAAQLHHVIDTALGLGPIDLVANVAGISDWFLPAHEIDDETWNRVMAVNVTAVMAVCRLVLPLMMQRGSGVITNVGSVSSMTGAIGGLAYTTSKHAIVGLTRSIASTYSSEGIRCNAVCPGAVQTNLDQKTAIPRSEWGYSRLKRMHRLCERVAEPDEVATLISCLSSPEASNVNGAVITRDGGWTA